VRVEEKALLQIAPRAYEPSGMQYSEVPFDIAKVTKDIAPCHLASKYLSREQKTTPEQ
jgi:hypothetical protein